MSPYALKVVSFAVMAAFASVVHITHSFFWSIFTLAVGMAALVTVDELCSAIRKK